MSARVLGESTLRDTAAELRKSARLLDQAADRTEAGAAGTSRGRAHGGGPPVDCNAIDA